MKPFNANDAYVAALMRTLPGAAFLLDEKGRCLQALRPSGGTGSPDDDRFGPEYFAERGPKFGDPEILRVVREALQENEVHTLQWQVQVQGAACAMEAQIVPVLDVEAAHEPTLICIIREAVSDGEASELLKQSQAELEQFTYSASHDLRAPLRSVKQLASWLQEDLQGHLVEGTQKHLDLLLGRVSRMDLLLEAFLDFSQVANGVELDQVSLDFAVQAAAKKMGPFAGLFRFQVPSDLPTVHSDEGLVVKILTQLFDNSIRHHDCVRGEIQVSATEGEDWVTLQVVDDGPGIPEAYRERVFEAFRTLKSRDEVEAAGMGLSIARKAATALGGRIWMEPVGERGSMFSLTLPKGLAGPTA